MANWQMNADIHMIELDGSGDDVKFLYEDSDEILLYVNSTYPAVLFREDVIELIGFLSQFVDGEI